MNILDIFKNKNGDWSFLKISGSCGLFLIILAILVFLLLPDLNNGSINPIVDFTDVDFKTDEYGIIKVTGKFKFHDGDHDQVNFTSRLSLKAGSGYDANISGSFRNIKNNESYDFQGSLVPRSANTGNINVIPLSEVQSITIIYNGTIVEKWENYR
ncbi:MAG: hypothetical protein LBV42_04865 [Methanobrevibacter sp.]|jgi:hypothetical protein|nr:hypothetical protein [Methanobrevibacter sp.]